MRGKYPPGEVAARGDAIYAEIKPRLGDLEKGTFVVIDIESGDYEIGADDAGETMVKWLGMSGGTLAVLLVVAAYVAILLWNDEGGLSDECRAETQLQFYEVVDHELAIRGIEQANRIAQGDSTDEDGEPMVSTGRSTATAETITRSWELRSRIRAGCSSSPSVVRGSHTSGGTLTPGCGRAPRTWCRRRVYRRRTALHHGPMTTEPADAGSPPPPGFRLGWDDGDDHTIVLVNAFDIFPLPPHEGGGIVLSIGQISPPILFGTDVQEFQDAVGSTALSVRTLLRAGMTREIAQELFDYLSVFIEAGEENTVADEEEADGDD